MNSQPLSLPDAARSQLRLIVARVDHEISRLPGEVAPGGGEKPANALAASWADLVKLLALGPEPEVRQCPVCNKLGMREATLCGYCWTKLPPFTARDGLSPAP
jgi:hypothetical protein